MPKRAKISLNRGQVERLRRGERVLVNLPPDTTELEVISPALAEEQRVVEHVSRESDKVFAAADKVFEASDKVFSAMGGMFHQMMTRVYRNERKS